jgi:hypothetical protein
MPEDLGYVLETTSQPRRFSNSSAYEPNEKRSAAPLSSEVRSLTKRYRDAYRVAGFIVGVGDFFKIAGIVLAALIGIGTLVVAGQTRNDQQQIAIFVVGIVIAAFAGGVLFLFGVLVAAQGQLLKASLDSAVNTSPFLTNQDRAKIMALPEPSPDSQNSADPVSAKVGMTAPSVPLVKSSTQGLVCSSCGSKLGSNVKFCGACGTRT